MKKVISVVGLAALIGVGSAQAAEIYKSDDGNTTYSLGADVQIQFRQDPGVDQDVDVEYDDLELKNDISHTLASGLTAFGKIDISANAAADQEADGVSFEEAHIGVGFQNYKIKVGKMDNAADGFGVGADIEGVELGDVFGKYGKTGGDDTIMVEAADLGGMVTIKASYEVEADSELSSSDGTEASVFATVSVAGATLGAAFQNYEAADTVETDEVTGVETITLAEDVNIWGVMAKYTIAGVTLGVDYGQAEDMGDVWDASIVVDLAPVTLNAGAAQTSPDAGDDVLGWYAGARYSLSANANVFAEVEGSDKDDDDPGFVVGMQVTF